MSVEHGEPMVEFQETSGTLNIEYKKRLVFTHSDTSPAVHLGTGPRSISGYLGNYTIEDHPDMEPLKDYEILDDSHIRFSGGGKTLDVSFKETDGRLVMAFSASASVDRFTLRLAASEDERIYGCGAQASHFNLRGHAFRMWISEAGVGRNPTLLETVYKGMDPRTLGAHDTSYFTVPMFVSSKRYWCHVDTSAYGILSFEGPDAHALYFWEVPKRIVIGVGEDYPALMNDLVAYTGVPPRLPDFVHDGVVLGLQGGTDNVLRNLQSALDADVKVAGIWVQDWVGHNTTSFGQRLYWNWRPDEQLYPDLTQTIIDLKSEGIAFLAYICPFLLKDESLYVEAAQKGYLARNAQGGPYIEDFGEFDCGLVDLTHPEAYHWFKSVIQRHLIDVGVAGWMADFGEYLPPDCVLHNGFDATLMHNRWPLLWARCNYDAVRERGKLGEIVYFMRAGSHGSQRYASAMWAGDQSVNWEKEDGIPSVTPITLSSAMTGVMYMHSDIGGYTSLHGNVRTKELFERWCEFAPFSAMMRTHEGNRPQENFQCYDDADTLKLLARMSAIRVDMKPYVVAAADQAYKQGLPLQRPVFMHYPEETAFHECDASYLFGRDVFVHPVVRPDAQTQTLTLPDDAWVHLFSGRRYRGGTHVIDVPLGSPPVFYRETSPFSSLFETVMKRYSE